MRRLGPCQHVADCCGVHCPPRARLDPARIALRTAGEAKRTFQANRTKHGLSQWYCRATVMVIGQDPNGSASKLSQMRSFRRHKPCHRLKISMTMGMSILAGRRRPERNASAQSFSNGGSLD